MSAGILKFCSVFLFLFSLHCLLSRFITFAKASGLTIFKSYSSNVEKILPRNAHSGRQVWQEHVKIVGIFKLIPDVFDHHPLGPRELDYCPHTSRLQKPFLPREHLGDKMPAHDVARWKIKAVLLAKKNIEWSILRSRLAMPSV